MAYKGAAPSLTVPTSRTESWSADGTFTVNLVYENFTKSALEGIRPSSGTELTALSYSGTYVTDVTIKTNTNQLATMTVNASSALTWLTTPGDGIVLRVRFVPLQQDLRYHPMFQTGGDYELSDQNRVDIDRALRGEIQRSALSAASWVLFDRLMRGQNTYTIYAPEASKITPSSTSPSTSGAGQVSAPGNPPFTGAPTYSQNSNPYTYVKTGDEFERVAGRWSRVEVWTGFEQVDTDVYNNL